MFCAPSCFFSFFVLRGDEKESKPILSLYFIANALPRSIASRPTFDCVSSHVRSCLVPRSLKSIGTAGPTHYFRVFKIEYWQPRPRRRKLRWPACNRLLRRQHCSSLCSQSEGHEHVANMASALGHYFVEFSARVWPPQYSSPSLCEQSELQCFASDLRRMFCSASCRYTASALLFGSKPCETFFGF